MAQYDAYSLREIGGQDRLEQIALHQTLQTTSGRALEVILVCGGVGGGGAGEQAARLASRAIIDSLEVTAAENIPLLLVTAIEEANRVVYSELRGVGSTTVALVAVDPDQGEYGRAYIASVGDAHIYLIRRREMVRLNIDHTLVNEYVYAEQMSRREAARLENADYPTRVVGIGPEVIVDIGFYAERGHDFVPGRRAFEIGRRGMPLQEGDTLLAATGTLFKQEGPPLLRRDDFLTYAMDEDAEHAVRTLLDIAVDRNPRNNLSLAVLLVPSRFRRTLRRETPVERAIRLSLLIGVPLLVIIVVGLGVLFFRDIQANRDAAATRTAFDQSLARMSWTPEFTPTATGTPTRTPTPTPTIRPTDVGDSQVAIQVLGPFAEPTLQPVFSGRRITGDDDNFLVIEGPNVTRLDTAPDPATIYLNPNAEVQFSLVRNGPGSESIVFQMSPQSDLFVRSGNFDNGGIQVSVDISEGMTVLALADCVTLSHIPPDPNDPTDTEKLALTCYGGAADWHVCSYRPPFSSETEIEFDQRILLDLDNGAFIEQTTPVYDEIKAYRDIVAELSGDPDAIACLTPYLDVDADGVPYPQDICEFEAGRVELDGCPDADNDNIRDDLDICPAIPGIFANEGCPAPTATPFNLDPDGDGLLPPEDQCPTVAGVQPDGCPSNAALPNATVAAWGP